MVARESCSTLKLKFNADNNNVEFYNPRLFVCEIGVNYWVGNKVISFFSMIFKASLLIQITNINQLCIDHFVR